MRGQSVDKVRVDKVCVDKVCGDKVCVDKVCVDNVCVDKVFVEKVCGDKVCVDKVCGECGEEEEAAEEAEEEPGIQNQKQEPHTKMWGTNCREGHWYEKFCESHSGKRRFSVSSFSPHSILFLEPRKIIVLFSREGLRHKFF